MVTVADILNQWQSAGIFDYVLPFLLVFSIVFGILQATNLIGANKGVHVIIALVVGMMAMRFGYVPEFFAQIFPFLGVGLGVILALLILTGLFINKEESRYWMYGIATIAVIVWIIVLISSFENANLWWGGFYFFENYASVIIGTVLVIGIIIAVVASKSEGQKSGEFKGFKRGE